jgi:hypothetical protein
MDCSAQNAAVQIGLLQKYGREVFVRRNERKVRLFDGCAQSVRPVGGDSDAGGALEDRSHWFILAFAGACALGSIYGFLQGAWPFGLVEAIWAGVALRRWYVRRQ